MGRINLFSKKWKLLNRIYIFGLFIILSLGIVGYILNKIPLMLRQNPTQLNAILVLSILLMLAVVFLALHWLAAVQKEILVYKNFFHEFIPKVPLAVLVPLVILMAFSLSLLCYISDNLIWFAIVLIIYKTAEIIGFQILKARLFKPSLIVNNKVQASDGRWQYWKIIIDYYLEKPHIKRSFVIILLALVSLAISLISKYLISYANIAFAGNIIAYAIMIANIIMAELVLIQWKKSRDEELYETGEYYK